MFISKHHLQTLHKDEPVLLTYIEPWIRKLPDFDEHDQQVTFNCFCSIVFRQQFGWRSIWKSNMQNTSNIFDVICSSLRGFFFDKLGIGVSVLFLWFSTTVLFSSTYVELIRMIPAPCNYSMCFLNGPVTSTFFFNNENNIFCFMQFYYIFLKFSNY